MSVYIHQCLWMYVGTDTPNIYIFMQVCTSVYLYKSMYVYMYTEMHKSICMFPHMYIVCMYECVHTSYMYAYMYVSKHP